jgi:hypothetical protein
MIGFLFTLPVIYFYPDLRSPLQQDYFYYPNLRLPLLLPLLRDRNDRYAVRRPLDIVRQAHYSARGDRCVFEVTGTHSMRRESVVVTPICHFEGV